MSMRRIAIGATVAGFAASFDESATPNQGLASQGYNRRIFTEWIAGIPGGMVGLQSLEPDDENTTVISCETLATKNLAMNSHRALPAHF